MYLVAHSNVYYRVESATDYLSPLFYKDLSDYTTTLILLREGFLNREYVSCRTVSLINSLMTMGTLIITPKEWLQLEAIQARSEFELISSNFLSVGFISTMNKFQLLTVWSNMCDHPGQREWILPLSDSLNHSKRVAAVQSLMNYKFSRSQIDILWVPDLDWNSVMN